jgi:hypothetical protein
MQSIEVGFLLSGFNAFEGYFFYKLYNQHCTWQQDSHPPNGDNKP